ncbi:YL1 nuclear protein C-terminal domain-containing protein [Melampsora americana]|nr:YL1 nuclear protein C-terminal domain-containing protein [Melampsora americana]
MTIEAPPSVIPLKKYCDITGLEAPYVDPKSSLRYHNVEVYELIKSFGPGVDQIYLSLRGAHTTLK